MAVWGWSQGYSEGGLTHALTTVTRDNRRRITRVVEPANPGLTTVCGRGHTAGCPLLGCSPGPCRPRRHRGAVDAEKVGPLAHYRHLRDQHPVGGAGARSCANYTIANYTIVVALCPTRGNRIRPQSNHG